MLLTACSSDHTAHRGTVPEVTRTAGSPFAPSTQLHADHQEGLCTGPQYERHLAEEMRALYRANRQLWIELMEDFLVRGRAVAALGPDLTRRLRRLAPPRPRSWTPLRGARALVHADHKPWNLLVRRLGAPREPEAADGWTARTVASTYW